MLHTDLLGYLAHRLEARSTAVVAEIASLAVSSPVPARGLASKDKTLMRTDSAKFC